MRRATDKKAHIALRVIGFLSTLSLRRATPGLVGHRVRIAISIHALLAESDRDQIKCQLVCTTFLSTLSLRRATNIIPIGMCVTASFLSTLSLRRATGILQKGCHELLISIHALLAESDGPDCQGAGPCQNFYPRSPCGERQSMPDAPTGQRNFYPRSPCGERQYCLHVHTPPYNFYPRSPCGERLSTVSDAIQRASISIHALLAESDHYGWSWYDDFTEFLSTLSLRRATLPATRPARKLLNFYPRSPCGERPIPC